MTTAETPRPLFQVDPAKYAMRLTTTLNRLRSAGACADRYRHLVRALGGVGFDPDAPINLLRILELNGIYDCIWSLRATEQNCETIKRLFAADCAESVLHIYEDQYPGDDRPRLAIEAARRFAVGEIDASARDAIAIRAAAKYAAAGAIRAAARDAAWAAVMAAAREPACWPAAIADQANIIRKYLLPDEVAE